MLAAVSVVLFCSCSQQSASKAGSKSNAVADVLNGQNETATEIKSKSAAKNAEKSTTDADVDLTTLNSNMVYSEVYHMVSEPDKYIGKMVRMNGQMDVYKDNGKTYYSCIIKDAAACCAQGFEFKLGKGGYPDAGDEITVLGEFSTYKEDKYTYCMLKNAVLES